eukprot:jgi/Mesvir1/13814/Mv15968-RA.1
MRALVAPSRKVGEAANCSKMPTTPLDGALSGPCSRRTRREDSCRWRWRRWPSSSHQISQERLGGRMQSVNVNSDFRFDTGPSLLLMPQKYYEGFEALGEDLDDHVALKRVMPAAYRVFFGDSSHLDLTADVGRMCQQLEEVEAGAGSQYLDFLAAAKATFDVSLPGFISRNFNSVMDYLNPAYLAPLLRRVDPLKLLGQHNRVLAGYFKDPRLRALFSFQDLYVGLSPYEAPGVFSLLAGTELVDGVWYPMGGFGKIRDALRGIAEKNGVKLQLNAEVASIEVDAGDRRVTGVRLKDGAAFPASAVVGNADLPYIYKHLINDAGAKSEGERLHRLQYSAGVIAFNWCLDTRPDRLLHHSVFLSDEYEASWRRASTAQQLPRRPNFYVHAPARTDPSVAPEGKDAITVLLPVANLQQQQEQQKQQGGTLPPESELVAAAREAVLRRFEECGVGDLRKHIIDEFVYSPTVWQSR